MSDPTRVLMRQWRRAVLHQRTDRRRRFPPRIQAGLPGGIWLSAAAALTDPVGDAAARADLVGRLLSGVPDAAPLVWLSREGQCHWHDLDASWLSAAITACAEYAMPCRFAVITRNGWYDPVTGHGRTWERLRDRRGYKGDRWDAEFPAASALTARCEPVRWSAC